LNSIIFFIFKRSKVPLELKILGLAFRIQLSSLRRATRVLSYPRSMGSLRRLFGSESGSSAGRYASSPRTPRRLIALDEMCVKVNGLKY
jgi:DNA-directed RNA polymerase specialized sigma54-like protein